ncbi:GntP family permease [Alloalcanivorax gelatiniphagus]|uniref:GntP family permease n=1 Tax=Alloalcanivorax gelatiniphagus TaxID=1194167 RepID=A0ABY2XI18_9GAMM|nr:GntP family permease [Alloalcanivorax gelatiniphagus]TMW11401.1 GntP family permease [Alloalcanivorax gelatiniphagus]
MLVASFLGLFAGLALLVVLTMRGVNIIISAVLCAMLVAVCSGLPLDQAMLESYMAGFTGFFTAWFPAILLGAIFGQLMDDSGAAKAIARQSSHWFGEKRAIMAVVGASAILTYGGVSVFVVGFSVYPIAFELFKAANLPHRFIPGAMVFGSISFTMTSPGSPEVQNLIPTEHFGTTAVAGGMIGVICALTILVLGAWAIRHRVRRAVNAGETFDPPAAAVRQHGRDDGVAVPTWAALLPLLVLVGGFNLLSLALGMRPVEALLVAMGASLLLGFVLFRRPLHQRARTLGTGADNALVATANTCAVVGFGAVAALTPAFKEIVAVLTGLPGLEYAGLAMAVTVIAGITGSASGGLGIALPILAPIYQGMGLDNGAMHRISALASGGLDSLPHNGYVVTTIRAVCKETHQRAYPMVFIASVLVPSVVLVLAVVLYTLV